ncbi:MAG: DinB family protein [Rhodothermia bacterium]|nr:DinB family protein [Rhodothermia bacterium]
MIYVESLAELYAHMEWADARVWSVVEALEKAQTDENLRKRLFHLHFTQLAFLGVWRGDDFQMRKADEFDAIAQIKAEARTFYPAAGKILAGLHDSDLSKPTPLPWARFYARQSGREPAMTTLGETMMQVALHTQHHRAQINTKIRELGGEPKLVDYIGWVWAGRPQAEW